MLTLPEKLKITKDLTGISPVIFLHFPGINYSVASQEFIMTAYGSDGQCPPTAVDFTSASAQFVTWGVVHGDKILIENVAGDMIEYVVDSVVSETELALDSSPPTKANADWSINLGISKSGADAGVGAGGDWSMPSATWITWNIQPGEIVTINLIEYVVDSVFSETEIFTTPNFPGGSNLSWGWSQTTYPSLIKKGFTLPITGRVSEQSNTLGSVGGLTVTLLDWIGTLRNRVIGTVPDLTDYDIDAYLILDINDPHIDNRLLVYQGKVSHWTVEDDALKINSKNEDPVAGSFPQSLLSDDNITTLAAEGTTKPLQYGEMLYNVNLRWTALILDQALAVCPVHIKTNYLILPFGNTGYYTWIIWISDHEVANVHDYATWAELIPNGSPFYVLRDNEYCEVRISDSFQDGDITISNTAAGCYATVEFSYFSVWIYRPLLAAGGANLCTTTFGNAIDGYTATDCWVGTGGEATILHLVNTNFSNIVENEPYFYDDTDDQYQVELWVAYGAITNSDNTIEWTDGTTTWSEQIPAGDANGWTVYDLNIHGMDWPNMTTLNALEVEFNKGGIGSSYVRVKHVCVSLRVQDVKDEKYVYWRIDGRKFSGTWGGRRTADTTITNSVDMIESIIRDEFGASVDTDSFDELKAAWGSVVCKASLYKSMDWRAFIGDICTAFHVSLNYNMTGGTWFISQQRASFYDFAVSGTGTALRKDIYTDDNNDLVYPDEAQGTDGVIAATTNFSSATATFQTWGVAAGDNILIDDIYYIVNTVTGETTLTITVAGSNGTAKTWSIAGYQYNPIKKGSFGLRRTSHTDRHDSLVINLDKSHIGYLDQKGTASGDVLTLNNQYISTGAAGTALLNIIDDIVLNQRSIVDFVTFFNAIGLEIGDLINVRHSALSDSMLNATVNTQKWMVIGIGITWHPAEIKITAIELL